MKKATNKKRLILKDFDERKAFDPESVVRVEGHDWEYIPIHPMANETEALNALGITPEDCTKVDCYWRAGEEVFFLQVYSQGYVKEGGIIRDTGFYARMSEWNLSRIYLTTCIDDEYITQNKFEEVMKQFDAYGIQNLSADNLPLGKNVLLPL